MPRCQSNQKKKEMCFPRTSQSPAARASARGRPLSSPDARGALRSPHCENQGGLAAITTLTPSLICLLLTPRTDFSSRLASSLPLTHTHTRLRSFSCPPFCSLGKGNGTERFTFRKAASATNLGSPALAGPGGVAGRFWAGRKMGSELGRRSSARKPPGFRRAGARAPAFSR